MKNTITCKFYGAGLIELSNELAASTEDIYVIEGSLLDSYIIYNPQMTDTILTTIESTLNKMDDVTDQKIATFLELCKQSYTYILITERYQNSWTSFYEITFTDNEKHPDLLYLSNEFETQSETE